jgi:acyl-coenzyme A synthetase/AMP-(fatty) acid ligase
MENNSSRVENLYQLAEVRSHEDLLKALGRRPDSRPTLILSSHTESERSALLASLPQSTPKNARLAMFTSGSTGAPKLIFHSEESLDTSGRQLEKGFGTHKNILCFLPPWGMAGIAFQVLLPKFSGARVLYPDKFLVAVQNFSDLIKKEKIDLCIFNPYILEQLILTTQSADLSSCRFVSLTAPLLAVQGQKFRARFGAPVEEIYGMTEAAGPVLLNGKSLGAEIQIGADQEICLSGAQFALGLAQAFPTGDLGVLEEGRIKILGRRRDYINVAGKKIPPRWIEEIVARFPGVLNSLALPVPDENVGEKIGLLLLTGESWQDDEFVTFLRTNFSEENRPLYWKRIGEFPRLSNGKVDRPRALDLLHKSI